MTFSILGRDPVTGCVGGAIASAQVAMGTRGLHARPGVGVVAAQAASDLAHGRSLLDKLVGGQDATGAIDAVLAEIDKPGVQFGVAGCDGSTAAHTGEACPGFAGHEVGASCTAQANLMASPTVWTAMVDAFASSDLPLPARLLHALAAGEAEGGDVRGVQSAAIVIVTPIPGDVFSAWFWDQNLDLRVDDDDDPIATLRATLDANTAQNLVAEAFHNRAPDALDTLERAAVLNPRDANVAFHCAVRLADAGRSEEAKAHLARAMIRNRHVAQRVAELSEPLRTQVRSLL